jgi:hypothetical protein
MSKPPLEAFGRFGLTSKHGELPPAKNRVQHPQRQQGSAESTLKLVFSWHHSWGWSQRTEGTFGGHGENPVLNFNCAEKVKMPRDQVFISYSHEDTKWREDLEKHLKPYL